MYLVPAKTIVTDAMRSVFTTAYPEGDFQRVNVTMDFPMEQQDYPAIWIEFGDTEQLTRVGVANYEEVVDNESVTHHITRFNYGGEFSFTVAALSSLERDRLYDEVVRVLAFTGVEDAPANDFRLAIEENPYMEMYFNSDVLEPMPPDANPGTPWGTDDVIYEKTVSIACTGTFASKTGTSVLVPLSAIKLEYYIEGEQPGSGWPPDTGGDVYEPGDWV